jgi:hypothetical protein
MAQVTGDGAWAEEEDHLVGLKVKEVFQPSGVFTLNNDQYGQTFAGCELKKPKYLFLQASKNAGDDPRGGPPGDFLCYNAKCPTVPGTIQGEDQFNALHTLEIKKTKLVCAPFIDPSLGRFQDNGDGTVTDRQTGLTWEQKDDLGGIHDKDNFYSWATSGTTPNGTAFTTFLGTLNNGTSSDGTAISGCFAGHCDWRLPTSAELQTIVDLSAPGCGSGSPCIYAELGPTVALNYWSSTTYASNPSYAWVVGFLDGSPGATSKTNGNFVRAVRGGS